MDAVVHVLRCFHNANVVHQTGEIDPVSDFETVRTELALADMEVLERRMAKDKKPAESGDADARLRFQACRRFAEQIDQGLRPVPQENETGFMAELGLLTAKPFVLVANADENELAGGPLVEAARGLAARERVELVVMCGDIEAEMNELPPEEQAEFLESLGQGEPGLNLLIRAAYRTLGLISFFTIVGAELRAWPAPDGARAVDCAGRIHTDMARGFIAAEVCSFADLVSAGSAAAARESGRMRLEGRDYPVRDGDVITFRFNV